MEKSALAVIPSELIGLSFQNVDPEQWIFVRRVCRAWHALIEEVASQKAERLGYGDRPNGRSWSAYLCVQVRFYRALKEGGLAVHSSRSSLQAAPAAQACLVQHSPSAIPQILSANQMGEIEQWDPITGETVARALHLQVKTAILAVALGVFRDEPALFFVRKCARCAEGCGTLEAWNVAKGERMGDTNVEVGAHPVLHFFSSSNLRWLILKNRSTNYRSAVTWRLESSCVEPSTKGQTFPLYKNWGMCGLGTCITILGHSSDLTRSKKVRFVSRLPPHGSCAGIGTTEGKVKVQNANGIITCSEGHKGCVTGLEFGYFFKRKLFVSSGLDQKILFH